MSKPTNEITGSASSLGSQDNDANIMVLPKREIVFKYYSNREVTAEFQILNLSPTRSFNYRVLCTSSKNYKVDPFKGELGPQQTIIIHSTLVTSATEIEKRMKDQFKVEYVPFEEDQINKSVNWNSPSKKDIKLSISLQFQRQQQQSVSPLRSTSTNSQLKSKVSNASSNQQFDGRSQQSMYSPNQSQINNSSNISQPYKNNQPFIPPRQQQLAQGNTANSDFHRGVQQEEYKQQQYSMNTNSQVNMLPQTSSSATANHQENLKYQQKYLLLKKRQEDQFELIKKYKEDIKRFHNEISKLNFIFNKTETKDQIEPKANSKLMLQPYQLSILVFAFLLIGALIRI